MCVFLLFDGLASDTAACLEVRPDNLGPCLFAFPEDQAPGGVPCRVLLPTLAAVHPGFFVP